MLGLQYIKASVNFLGLGLYSFSWINLQQYASMLYWSPCLQQILRQLDHNLDLILFEWTDESHVRTLVISCQDLCKSLRIKIEPVEKIHYFWLSKVLQKLQQLLMALLMRKNWWLSWLQRKWMRNVAPIKFLLRWNISGESFLKCWFCSYQNLPIPTYMMYTSIYSWTWGKKFGHTNKW